MKNLNTILKVKQPTTTQEKQFVDSLKHAMQDTENDLLEIANNLFKGNRHTITDIKFVVSDKTLSNAKPNVVYTAKFYLQHSSKAFASIKQVRFLPYVQAWE